jgi:hypothetical protein
MVPAVVPIDERHIASAVCNSREHVMCHLLNNTDISDEILATIFPCAPSIVREFRTTVLQRCDGFQRAVRAGGLATHYDLELLTPTRNIRAELKVTKKKSSAADVLRWTPWVDTVQFLQGQITSQIGRRFLGDCGEPMIQAWFHDVVKPFSVNVEGAAEMTAAGYQKAMMSMNLDGKHEEAARVFISALRAQPSLQKQLQSLWLDFEVRWFSTHRLDDAGLEEVVRNIIETKDAWICVAKNQIQWVDGIRVLRLESLGPTPKKMGGMLFRYHLVVQSGIETKTVPMECKFHWKNGGQAVQNLNFLLL